MPLFIFILFVALLPVGVLLYYIFRKDKYQQEPPGQMLRAFCYGIAAAFLSLVLTTPFAATALDSMQELSVWGAITKAFCLAAIPEETAKLIMLWLFLRKCLYFDEHMDGIVYAVSVSMGFAALENILYLFGNYQDFLSVGITRALFAIPGHFFFGVLMGYYYSLAKFANESNQTYWILTIVAPVLAHGCYDSLVFLMQVAPSLSVILTFVFLIFCHYLRKYCSQKIEEHLERDRMQAFIDS